MSKSQPVKLAVVRTEGLSPHMLRVVFGGEGFSAFLSRYDNLAPQAGGTATDCYVKLVLLDPDTVYPEPLDLDQVRDMVPQEAWPVLRTYTVRWVDPQAEELAIDFVMHGDEGHAGPWAARAKPGDVMHMRGPSGAYAPDPDADWHLFVGDEAAIPAIGAALERLEAGAKAVAFIEIDDESEQQAFATKADLDLAWLHRGSAQPGSTGLLDEAVRALDWLPGRVHAFVHGESSLLKSVRPYVLTDRGVPRADVSVSGYWRRGNTEESFRVWKSRQTA
ncbi:MAG: siderophore-interacting protein [Aeromicrobium sp.]